MPDKIKSNETAHWVKPDLVAQVRFTEWTDDGKLRHPVYLGLRDDKRADAVVREGTSVNADQHSAAAPAALSAARSRRARASGGGAPRALKNADKSR